MGMKAASDSNELVFTLRVAPHTRNASDLKSFGDQVIREQKRIADASSSIRGNKSAITTFGFPDEKELAKASSAQLRHQQRQAEAQKKALDKEAENVRKAAAEKAAAEKKAADDAIKEVTRVEAARLKSAAAKAKADKKAADDAIREAKREAAEVEREQDRQHQRHRQRQLERARRNRTTLEESVANAKAEGAAQGKALSDANSKAMAMHERARAQLISAQEGIRSELAKTGQGVLQLGHGFALLGLVGEKDAEKFLSALAKIEGIFQIAKGGLDIYQGLANSAKKYREAVLQAAIAEHALGRARAASAASNGLGGLGGSAIRGGGALGGAGALAGGGGLGVGSLASAGPAVAAIAAIAAVGLALKEFSEIANGTSGLVDSMTSKMGRFEEWVLSFIGKDFRPDITGGVYTNTYNSEQRRKSQEKTNNSAMANRARQREFGDLEAEGNRERGKYRQSRAGIDADLTASTFSDPAQQKRVAIEIKAMAEESESVRLRGEVARAQSDKQRADAMNALLDLENRRTDSIVEDLKTEKEISRTKLDAARESLQSLKEEQKIQQDIMKEEGDRLKSAAEKFADLDDEKRNKLFDLKKRLEEADRQQPVGGGFVSSQIRKSITKEDRDLLKSIGLRDLDEGAQKVALEDARRKGFDRFAAGSQEAQRFRQAANQSAKIEAELKDQRELVVNIKRDDAAIAAAYVKLIQQQLNIRDAALEQKIQNDLEAKLLEQSRTQDQRLLAAERSRR